MSSRINKRRNSREAEEEIDQRPLLDPQSPSLKKKKSKKSSRRQRLSDDDSASSVAERSGDDEDDPNHNVMEDEGHEGRNEDGAGPVDDNRVGNDEYDYDQFAHEEEARDPLIEEELEAARLREALLQSRVEELETRLSSNIPASVLPIPHAHQPAASHPLAFIPVQDIKRLTALTHDQAEPFATQFQGPDTSLDWHTLVNPETMELLATKFAAMDPPLPDETWMALSNNSFADYVLKMCPADRASTTQPFPQRMGNLHYKLSARDLTINDGTIAKMLAIEAQTSAAEILQHQRSVCSQIIKDKLARGNSVDKHVAKACGLHNPTTMPTTMKDLRVGFLRVTQKMHNLVQQVSEFATDVILPGDDRKPSSATQSTSGSGSGSGGGGRSANSKSSNNNHNSNKAARPMGGHSAGSHSAGSRDTVSANCSTCGRSGHPAEQCAFRKSDGTSWHPNANVNSSTAWANSSWGRQFAAKGINTLPFTRDITGNAVIVPDTVKSTAQTNKNKKNGELILTHLLSLQTTTTDDDYVKCHLTLPNQDLVIANDVMGLLDNGALGTANYISVDIAAKLLAAGVKSNVVSKQINSAFNAVHGHSKGTITFDVLVTPEHQHTPIKISIDAFIIDSSINLILGRKCIKENKLVQHFPSHFYLLAETPEEADRNRVRDDGQSPCHHRDTTPLLTAMRLRNLIEDSPDDYEYDVKAFEAFESIIEPPQVPIDNILDLITIETDDELRYNDVRALLEEYRDIFSETLPEEPADLPPLELEIDRSLWEQPKHHLPPRAQTPSNQVEIQRQLDLYKKQNIIRSSNAPYYSQVHLAEKPPKGSGKKRFCIDFVLLNLCTKTVEKWPLPNIQQMLQRLGNKRPKYFAVLDLTSGYHQAPMSMSAIAFTAFICFSGIYEFLRVPFGLKGAPSYFQRVLANVVLAGLLYITCELYIDDIIVQAQTAAEFLGNVKTVFDRMRKHRLYLSPRKVKIGLKKVEYTGHVISRDGISFSSTKIKSVLDFPIPDKKRQIKQFIGLVNYFRDHIKHHSIIVAPLQALVKDYTTRQAHMAVQLNEEAIAAFRTIKAMIEDCPVLFFLDDTSEVFLFTDACNYGIGGYLVQMVPNSLGVLIERPIAFMSRSLTPGQVRWDIPQKESYAIYAAIQKFEYLLRDRKFIIKTDHKNITFLNTSVLSSIRKWKIYISEFDSEFDYEKGEDNVVADLFSRLVEDQTPVVDKDPIFLLAFPGRPKIPQKEYRLIGRVHNSLVGHHGVERTLGKLLRLCTALKLRPWVYMRQHVKLFIKQCPCCQKMSVLKTPIVAHPFTTSSYLPMERLNIDYIGPFPDGNYILVILDCFSRWVELYLCTQATALETARALLNHIGRYGSPMQLLSDRGSHFVNEIIQELLILIGPEHCMTIAYSKEESALIERENKEINRHLRALFFDTAIIEKYIDSIPLVQRILNASETRRTGLPPCKLLFGNMIDLDRGILIPREAVPDNIQSSLSDRMSSMLQLQTKLIQIAEQSIRDADNAHISTYSADRTEFPVNSHVLLDYPTNPPTRLHTRKRGPYKVIRFSGNDYVLLDLVSNKEQTVNITRLSPFEFDPLRTDPRQVANKDQSAFDIDQVLAHRGNLHLKRTLEFLVSWVGYDATYNSWEPWKNVRNTLQLHTYLRTKGLTSVIPKNFR